jgi:hypothetical protein
MPMQAQEGAGPTTLQPLYFRESLGTHCKGGWVVLGAGLGGTENLATIEIRFPDCPAHSALLCRLFQILNTTRYYKDLMRQVCIFSF